MKMFGKLTSLFLFLCLAQISLAETKPISPTDKNGRTLNLDFEDGTLRDWKTTGNAFAKQPVEGDTVAKRRSDMRSQHLGNFWIGTYENGGDDLTGTLTSVPFKITQPYCAFLVAGGSKAGTRVELYDVGIKKPFFQISGEDSENLRPIVVELKGHVGREMYIRVVDSETGGWGHINFDDFKFYEEPPTLPNAIDLNNRSAVPAADEILYAGLSPEDAAAKMTLPPGFKATLFAGEPDVKQPIAFAFDDRGRIWIAEAYTYPNRIGTAPAGNSSEPNAAQLKDIFGGKDRIICFEDSDGDGKFDKRTVVVEHLNLVSGIEIGFGGIYVGAAPYLMYFKIQDGDEPKAVGNPQILLDGWAYQDTHETLNTFTWGPDGWLYGCQGVFTHSNVGKPGAPKSERTTINAGVWRYHPTKHIFELFSEGTSNPWGIDFDEHGQAIVEACVIPHLFHMMQGGRSTRQAGPHIEPFTYDDIKTIADHVHYAGNKGPHAGNGRSASMGGGHAHAGLLIYQGNNWPEQYHGKLFMNNIHGARINMDIPEREGSGFVAHHGKDFINFNDVWSQVVNLQTGPDGAVYMIDWYDKNQCHSNDEKHDDRSNGRIFKISYGDTKVAKFDLQKLSDEELVKLLASKNNWQARHAQRILQERFAKLNSPHDPALENKLDVFFGQNQSASTRLRILWAKHVTEGFYFQKNFNAYLQMNKKDSDEYLRAWGIQLGLEELNTPAKDLEKRAEAFKTQFFDELSRLAREDKSPVVRLYLASALQRIPVSDRWEIAEALYSHSEDAGDRNLPLMYWYGAEPLAAQNPKRALQMAEATKLPNLLNFTVRRVAALGTSDAMHNIVESLIRGSSSAHQQLEILNGLSVALKGQRSVTMPLGWSDIEKNLSDSPNAEIRALVQSLSLTFGSPNALASLKKTLMDKKADVSARRTALESLLNAKDKELAPLLLNLLDDADLRGQALRGLAAYDDSQTPQKIIADYNTFDSGEKRDALNTLASRAAFAKPLLAAVGAGKISRKDLSADLIRQLGSFKDPEVAKELEKVWGAVRQSSADKKEQIEKYKRVYWAGGSQPGDASRGRLVFSKTCQQCHTLFDTGGKVGPDLTGSNRGDLDYILQNMVDPNSVIPNDYRASTLETKDDRVITGIVKAQDEKSVTLITPNETVTVPRNEIASLRQNDLSMMPEGLLDPLSDQEVRDLIYYLSRPGQVPLPAGQ